MQEITMIEGEGDRSWTCHLADAPLSTGYNHVYSWRNLTNWFSRSKFWFCMVHSENTCSCELYPLNLNIQETLYAPEYRKEICKIHFAYALTLHWIVPLFQVWVPVRAATGPGDDFCGQRFTSGPLWWVWDWVQCVGCIEASGRPSWSS